jgi:hypothetical protein
MPMLIKLKSQVLDAKDVSPRALLVLFKRTRKGRKGSNERGDYRKMYSYGRRRNDWEKNATEWNEYLDALDQICGEGRYAKT